ncbi:MAG TPA: hypothetical protein VHO92_10255 [Methanobacterium sp.]|nr:hypothetical protein [Methanobacterium sp.]
MKWLLVALSIIAIIIGYSYITVSNGPIDPLGRLSFVKLANPDMYPGHPDSELLAKYAEERGSKCALVVHFAGSSNYRSYEENSTNDTDSNSTNSNQNGVYIIEVGFIDTQGTGSSNLSQINLLDSLKVALFGIPDGRYKYMSDGVVYNTYDEMMAHVNELAREHGQEGAIPMVWHGTVRQDNPVVVQGCGFPLYFQVLTRTYGIIPAYVYTIEGMIFPYFNNPYRDYELKNYAQLQSYYDQGLLNENYKKVNDTYQYNIYKSNQNSYE